MSMHLHTRVLGFIHNTMKWKRLKCPSAAKRINTNSIKIFGNKRGEDLVRVLS